MPKPFYEGKQQAWKLIEILCANPNINISIDKENAEKIIEFVDIIAKNYDNQ